MAFSVKQINISTNQLKYIYQQSARLKNVVWCSDNISQFILRNHLAEHSFLGCETGCDCHLPTGSAATINNNWCLKSTAQ